MTEQLKRYMPNYGVTATHPHLAVIYESPDGEMVLHSDYSTLLALAVRMKEMLIQPCRSVCKGDLRCDLCILTDAILAAAEKAGIE